jgi:hypothetical protein
MAPSPSHRRALSQPLRSGPRRIGPAQKLSQSCALGDRFIYHPFGC